MNEKFEDRYPEIYPHSSVYAREHGELEQYRQSMKMLRACRQAIDREIRENFDGVRLTQDTVKPVLAEYGEQRTALILSATVQDHKWDSRFSRDTRTWAAEHPLPDSFYETSGYNICINSDLTANSHPSVLDGFISEFRKEVQLKGQERQEPEKFTDEQQEQIQAGKANGLTDKQISLYADRRFNIKQMNEIRWGLEQGLSAEQVALYADPKFGDVQMQQIRVGLKHGLTSEELAIYADSRLNGAQMEQIRWSLEDGLTAEQVKLYANPQYTWEQMAEIRKDLVAQQKKPQQSYSINLNGQAVTVQAGSEQEAALKAVEQLESQAQAAPQSQKQEPTQAPTGPKLTM